MSSYLSLAAIENAELLAQHIQVKFFCGCLVQRRVSQVIIQILDTLAWN